MLNEKHAEITLLMPEQTIEEGEVKVKVRLQNRTSRDVLINVKINIFI